VAEGAKGPAGMMRVHAAVTTSVAWAELVLSGECGFHHLLLGSPAWQSGYLHMCDRGRQQTYRTSAVRGQDCDWDCD
jgi:hypothetical protein